jgi:excisionase family DNA binding protein
MTRNTTTDKLHSAESAAELLGVRPSTIRSWWTIGKLRRVKIGRLTRVRESELLSLIQTDPANPFRKETK